MAEKEENPSTTLGASKKSEAALREETVLEFWRENKIFEKSLEKKSPNGEFVFYDGPVTSNSAPVLHTMEPFSFKDAIPRYKTMRGFHVRRKGGWDTHGLPVELQIEKKLGFNSKNDIEKYGIAAFNKLCKDSVWKYIGLWKKFTQRVGYWADQDNAYVTYHNDYIESVWNVLKKVDEQKLLYKDYKVVPWCPRCGTALSSHELAQGYEDVKDLSVTAKFHLRAGQKFGKDRITKDSAYILAWTTTPWTLPGNVALAVGEKIKYTALRIVGVPELYILATDRVKDVFKDQEIEIVHDDIKGKDLIGLEYEMLYPYLADTISESEKIKLSKAFKIYGANFVTTEDGTGVVHTAVMYGQDDFVLGTKIGLPKHHLVGLDGKFLAGTGIFEGRFVRDENVAVDVIKDLAHRGLLFKKEKYEHSYPHCWRCHTALIYYARDSWYIRMSDKKIKEKMIAENKEINWEPAHIRDGRFGQWLEEIKDWAISRERYWGTPLPVWICDSCKKIEVIGSIADLKNKTKKSGNKYFVMRHGEAENNIEGSIHYKEININAKLTEKGKEQISKSSKNFKEKIDVVFSSPFNRSKETARIVCAQIGFPFEKIIYDKRIQELEPSSIFEGKERAIFKKYYDEDYLYNPNKFLPDGESFTEIIKRVGQFIYELETKYSDKNILIFSHEGAGDALSFVVKGLSLNNLSKEKDSFISLKNAEIRKFDFIPLPHNENYELDLHRPYIDEIKLICGCGNNLTRTKEVMDVWFDSGAMPFAQDHYPFDFAQGKPFENKKLLYPADFISEAIDQTRGWFYTLHAVGILMGRGRAYKNVICLGHLMDAKGKKMSKSVGNIVDPWEAINKYGADTLRLWMYSVNQPGESKNFDEKTVVLLHQQVFGLLYNVLAFYELYKDKEIEEIKTLRFIPHNVLDCWILSQTDTLTALMTSNLDNYKLLEPVRMIRTFIDDLSTWYLQCSRERIKEGDLEAKKSLYLVLKNLAKLMAPFAPFTAEDIWRKLRKEGDLESVHLAEWPEIQFMNDTENTNAYIQMKLLRNIVSLGLEARQKAKIKVRQPLQKLTIGYGSFEQQYIEIMKDKLNVKEITVDKSLDQLSVNIDTNITPELKQEGYFRELVRALQDNRKKMGLTPSDMVSLVFETDEMGKNLIQKFEKDLKKTVLVSEIEFKNNSGEEIKIGELIFKVKIEKI